MSTRICVQCPTCDVVVMAAHEVTIRHCTDDGRWDYWFHCPTCDRRAAGRSNAVHALEAFAVGSHLDAWQLPAEMYEPHDGPPLTLLDLLEFSLALTEPEWFRELPRTLL
jgi:hypothetical protein